jgi:hypothetical protein
MSEGEDKEEQIVENEQPGLWKKWLKRFGVGGLIFFTIKGCISLSIILFGGSWLLDGCNGEEEMEMSPVEASDPIEEAAATPFAL